jgi:hypothetical protein
MEENSDVFSKKNQHFDVKVYPNNVLLGYWLLGEFHGLLKNRRLDKMKKVFSSKKKCRLFDREPTLHSGILKRKPILSR